MIVHNIQKAAALDKIRDKILRMRDGGRPPFKFDTERDSLTSSEYGPVKDAMGDALDVLLKLVEIELRQLGVAIEAVPPVRENASKEKKL